MLLTAMTGEIPTSKVDRFDKKNKKMVSVDCPNLVKQYNKHMGGLDLLDSLLGGHKIKIRSGKWYFRIFYHLLDYCKFMVTLQKSASKYHEMIGL